MALNWHDYFIYEATSGNLIWKPRPREHFKNAQAHSAWNTRFSGKVAGTVTDDGYRMVTVNGEGTLLHRIVWEMHKGAIPEGIQIDHIDTDKTNSRLRNLRSSSDMENRWNTPARKKNASGLKGVVLFKRDMVWVAQITANHTRRCIGRFPTKGMAGVAYAKASLMYHGKFSPYYKPVANA